MPAPPRVLVVARRPWLSGSLRALLRAASADVIVVDDLREARAAVDAAPHAAVVVQLEVGGALDLCRWLRQHAHAGGAVLIAVDRPAPASARAEALAAGCDLVVPAPGDPFALAALLEQVVPCIPVDDDPRPR